MDRKIGIDNYGLFPLELTPIETLEWAANNNADGVAFSGLAGDSLKLIDGPYLNDIKQFSEENGLYLEWGGASHIPYDMTDWRDQDITELNRKAAFEATKLGTRIVRSCSGGLMRWNPESPPTELLIRKTANALKAQKEMLMDHNVILALETHFEFTTFELLKIFEICETEPGEYLGICLDTMNLLTLLEHPTTATERILPWVVSSHMKDGAILITSLGMKSFPSEIGKGVIDINKISGLMDTLPMDIMYSVEDHGGFFDIPIANKEFLIRFPHLTLEELKSLESLAHQTEAKMRSGELSITSREEWPSICEDRIRRDVSNLKEILK